MLDSRVSDLLWFDADARETMLRTLVAERLAASPPERRDDSVVASYFFALRTASLDHTVKEIAYHATSGIKNPPPGSLLAECTAEAAGVDAWDSSGRIGLLHVAFPLKMLLQPDGHLTSCDLLHTVAGAIIFDVYENQDAQLVSLAIPEHVLRTFPGPAYGPFELRRLAGFAAEEPAFGTILKPTAGITPDEVGQLVAEAAECHCCCSSRRTRTSTQTSTIRRSPSACGGRSRRSNGPGRSGRARGWFSPRTFPAPRTR